MAKKYSKYGMKGDIKILYMTKINQKMFILHVY